VYTEGIANITSLDVAYASALGCVIKLIGKVRREGDRIHCMVAPHLISKDNLLADINDVFNGVAVRGNAVGDVVFYGRGAGKLPTASAVVADVIDAARHLEQRKPLMWNGNKEAYVYDQGENTCSMLLRFHATDKQALLDSLNRALGAVTMVACETAPADELCVTTEPMTEAALEASLASVGNQPIARLRLL
jgi:homoserine dehydrogenase